MHLQCGGYHPWASQQRARPETPSTSPHQLRVGGEEARVGHPFFVHLRRRMFVLNEKCVFAEKNEFSTRMFLS